MSLRPRKTRVRRPLSTDSVNNDGTVITGYDYGEIIDPEFGSGVGRRICVWTNGVQTLIDDLSSAFSTIAAGSVSVQASVR